MLTFRRTAAAFAALVVVLALAACGGGSDSSTSTSASTSGSSSSEPVKATLLMNWFAQAEQGGYWQAQAAETGKKDGLTVDVKQGGPQIQTIPQVAAGQADFGVAQADELMLAKAEGVPIVEVFGGMDNYLQCLMFHPDAGIKDFSDISGHQVAVAPSGGFWPYLKGKYNLTDVQEINFTGSLAEFKRNKNLVQQCFITSEPYFAKQQNIPFETMMVSKSGYNPYSQGLFTSEKMIKDHPETVQKVVDAVREGWSQFLQDPAKAKALVLQVNKDMEPAAFDYAAKVLADGNYFAPDIGSMTAERWNTLHQQLQDAGVLDKDVDPSTVWTDQFVGSGSGSGTSTDSGS